MRTLRAQGVTAQGVSILHSSSHTHGDKQKKTTSFTPFIHPCVSWHYTKSKQKKKLHSIQWNIPVDLKKQQHSVLVSVGSILNLNQEKKERSRCQWEKITAFSTCVSRQYPKAKQEEKKERDRQCKCPVEKEKKRQHSVHVSGVILLNLGRDIKKGEEQTVGKQKNHGLEKRAAVSPCGSGNSDLKKCSP